MRYTGDGTMKVKVPSLNFSDSRVRVSFELLLVFFAALILWTIFRSTTGDIVASDETIRWTFQIIFQPLLWMGPVIAYMVYREGFDWKDWKAMLYSWGLRREGIIKASLFGLGFCVVLYGAWMFNDLFSGTLSGLGVGEFGFTWYEWKVLPYILMTFAVFAVVGTTEELFNRGFFQTRFTDMYGSKAGIIISAVMFAAGHIPVSLFVHGYGFWNLMTYMVFTGTFGIIMSYLFIKTRNIIAPILLHGLWDWIVFSMSAGWALEGSFANESVELFLYYVGINAVILAFALGFLYISTRVLKFDDRPLSIPDLDSFKMGIRDKDTIKETFRKPIVSIVTILIVLWLILLPIAGSFVSPTDEDDVFDVNFLMETGVKISVPEFTVGLDETVTKTVEISGMNVSSVTFIINMREEFGMKPISGTDQFSIKITGPNGQSKTTEGNANSKVARIIMDVAPIPAPLINVTEWNETAYTSILGQGTWTVAVTATSTTLLPGPVGSVLDGEGHVSFTATPVYYYSNISYPVEEPPEEEVEEEDGDGSTTMDILTVRYDIPNTIRYLPL